MPSACFFINLFHKQAVFSPRMKLFSQFPSLLLALSCLTGVAWGQTTIDSPDASATSLSAPSLPPETLKPLQSARALKLTTAGDSPVLPLTIPGYELRVMDVNKKMTYNANGTPVMLEVPIFIYMPTAALTASDANKDLHAVYNDLISVYSTEKVDREQIRDILKRMDTALDKFENFTSVAKTIQDQSQPQ